MFRHLRSAMLEVLMICSRSWIGSWSALARVDSPQPRGLTAAERRSRTGAQSGCDLMSGRCPDGSGCANTYELGIRNRAPLSADVSIRAQGH
jgi:hypothetical protein